jgi:hypothetical protein
MDADDKPDMVSQGATGPHPELRKRRTTRIVQAVPLIVTGVDALGRPFQERTSTLIVNCHGCRFQSKHYVLKNMWLNLEIPNPEPERPPRTVRGKVVWIQRPRTVRQLFQVALELEVPGNVWGIAFPPDDWFPFPETPSVAPQIEVEAEEKALPVAAAEAREPEAEAEFARNNLHLVTPATGTDASLHLARQVARLIAEAKQQIQVAAREVATQAVTAESQPALADFHAKLEAAKKEMESSVASAVERATQHTAAQLQQAKEAAAAALQEELPRFLASHLERVTRQMMEQLSQVGAAQRALQEQQISAGLATARQEIEEVARRAETISEQLRTQSQHFEKELAERTEAARQQWERMTKGQMAETSTSEREAMQAAVAKVRQETHLALLAAEETWRRRLASELDEALKRLKQSIESSLATAEQRAVDEAEAKRKAWLDAIDGELASRSAAWRTSFDNALRQAEDSAVKLRGALDTEANRAYAALADLNHATARLEELSARLEEMRRDALAGMESQLKDVAGKQAEELRQRSDTLAEEFLGRIRQALEDAEQSHASRLEERVAATLGAHLSRAEELAQRLSNVHGEFHAALENQRQQLQRAAEESISASAERLRESLGAVEKEAEEKAQGAVIRSLSELDTKAASVQHTTIESFYKSVEWYEKKLQMQLQALLDKGVEQAGNVLRERAGELSGVFASELDHYSRSFVDHAQAQMEEVVKDAFERARSLFSEAAETTTAAFTDEIQRNARQELDGFDEALRKSLEDSRTLLEEHVGGMRRRITAESEQIESQFRAGMSAAIQSGVAETHKQVEAGLGVLMESWRSMTEAHQNQMRSLYAQLGDESVEQYKKRLENVSNSWMVATVSSLDHQSRNVLSGLTQIAEEKLRDTCNQVFGQAAETLRQRLLEIGATFLAHPLPQEQK